MLSDCILFCPVWVSSLGDLILSETEMKMEWIGGRGEGEGEGGVEGGETMVGMYCMGEESIFKKESSHTQRF